MICLLATQLLSHSWFAYLIMKTDPCSLNILKRPQNAVSGRAKTAGDWKGQTVWKPEVASVDFLQEAVAHVFISPGQTL